MINFALQYCCTCTLASVRSQNESSASFLAGISITFDATAMQHNMELKNH